MQLSVYLPDGHLRWRSTPANKVTGCLGSQVGMQETWCL